MENSINLKTTLHIPNLPAKTALMDTYLAIFRCYREYFGKSNAAGIMLALHIDQNKLKHEDGDTLASKGMSVRYISAMTGIPKSTVNKTLGKMLQTVIFEGDGTNFAFAYDKEGIPIIQREIPEVKKLLEKFFKNIKKLEIE